MSRKRIVVTGIGIISPLGRDAKSSWQNLIAGKSGISALGDEYNNLPCKVAAQIKNFDLRNHFQNSELRTMAPATALGILAAKEALQDAGWVPEDDISKQITGVAVGMGMVDLTDVCLAYDSLKTSYKRVSPFFVPRILPNMAAGNISIKFGFRGPNHSVSTACATGLHAIGDGFRFIRYSGDYNLDKMELVRNEELNDNNVKLSNTRTGLYDTKLDLPSSKIGVTDAKSNLLSKNQVITDQFRSFASKNLDSNLVLSDPSIMLCGATEMCISPLSIAAFCRLRALSTSYNESPELSSRPFDKHRDGFVMGEGAAMLVLEELSHAKHRGAKIYAEILGYGLSGDASHLTAPKADGSGAILAMKRALSDAKISPNEVGYINAHATSTPLGDNIELLAIKKLFEKNLKNLAVSSTKGAHGHLLGSAGNLEAAFTIMAIKEGILPPTLNLEECPEMNEINLVPKITQKWAVSNNGRRIALKNAFGFGGTNACICFGEYVE